MLSLIQVSEMISRRKGGKSRALLPKAGKIFRRFALTPFIYQPEVVSSDKCRNPPELSIKYDGKKLHVARLGRRRSVYRSVYRILGGDSSPLPVIVSWRPEGIERFEIHGQSVAAFGSTNEKVAELLIHSNVPTQVRMGKMEHESRFPLVIMSGPSIDSRLSVLQSKFMIVERGVGHEGGWNTWQNVLHLNYWLDVPRTANGKKSLAVMFSALSPKYDFTYNYKSALGECDSYRLYLIDDFGERGSYYFADHRDTTIFDEVQLFLHEMIDALGVSPENVIFGGSSKGGTGALLHGLALGAGKVLVGAPQVYPGTYLQKVAPDILSFIAGSTADEARDWLDGSITERITASDSHTVVRIIVGARDHHLVNHVQPLLAMTDTPRHDVKALVIPDLSHDDIGSVYRHYLKNVLDRPELEDIDTMLPHSVHVTRGTSMDVEVQVWHPSNEMVTVDLYVDAVLDRRIGYVENNFVRISDLPGDRTTIRFSRVYIGETVPFACFDTSPIWTYERSN